MTMKLLVMLLGLFCFGLLTDVFFCLQVQATTALKNIQATFYTILLTSVGMAANWIVIKNDDAVGFVVYVVGCGAGTFLTTTPAIRKPIHRIYRRVIKK